MVVSRVVWLLMVPGCRLWFDPIAVGTDANSDPAVDSVLACGTGAPRTLTFGERADSMVKNVTSDTMVASGFPTENYGGTLAMSVRASPSEHGLLRFDLGSLTMCAEQVTRARLQLFLPDSGDQVAGTLAVGVVSESWVEGTNQGGAGPGATWQVRDTGIAWSTPGGTAGGAIATVNAGNVGAPVELDLPPNVIDAWIASPSSNFGMFLTSPNGHWHPIAQEATEPPQRPQLVVDLAPNP